MGLFTPKWMSDGQSKALKAVEKITDPRKLAEVAVNAKDPFVVRKAIERMDDGNLLAILRGHSADSTMYVLCREAIQNLSPTALAEVALDPKLDGWLRSEAIKRIDDEDVLFACARDTSFERPGDALSRMHTGERIVDAAMGNDLFFSGFRRLSELNDRKNMRVMALNAANARSGDAMWVVKAFETDTMFLNKLAKQAVSEYVRTGAFQALARKGLATEEMRGNALARARELIRAENADRDLILDLLRGGGPGQCVSAEEKEFLYSRLKKSPCDYFSMDYLFRAGDPVGIAFMPFYRVLYEEEERRPLSEEEIGRVLALDEDFALDYLLAFIRNGEFGNGRIAGPRIMITPCAKVIFRMYEAGKARARIERELPETKEYNCRYEYCDSENDIRYNSDRFSVRFWGRDDGSGRC